MGGGRPSSRRIAVQYNKVSLAAAPHSLTELTNATWRGKVALAYPLLRTTATHFLALRQCWSEERCGIGVARFQRNRTFLVDGNSVSAKLVAKGEAWIGLTDSDDIAAEQREGASIVPLAADGRIASDPETVAVVRGARHQQAARNSMPISNGRTCWRSWLQHRHWKACSPPTGRTRRSSRIGRAAG